MHTGSVIHHWRDSVGTFEPRRTLFGRDEEVARITENATSPEAAPLILVTGPTGIGRSAVLDGVRETLTAHGAATLTLRMSRNERDRPQACSPGCAPNSASCGGRTPAGARRAAPRALTGVPARVTD